MVVIVNGKRTNETDAQLILDIPEAANLSEQDDHLEDMENAYKRMQEIKDRPRS